MEFPWMLFTGIWTFTLSLRGSLRSGVTKWTYVHEWPTYECLSRLTYVCTSTENQPSPVSPPSSLKQQPSPQRPELSTDGRSHTMSVDTVKEVRKKTLLSPLLTWVFLFCPAVSQLFLVVVKCHTLHWFISQTHCDIKSCLSVCLSIYIHLYYSLRYLLWFGWRIMFHLPCDFSSVINWVSSHDQ